MCSSGSQSVKRSPICQGVWRVGSLVLRECMMNSLMDLDCFFVHYDCIDVVFQSDDLIFMMEN